RVLALPRHRNGLGYVSGHFGTGRGAAVPNPPAVSGDVDHCRIGGVQYHAVAPLEVVAPQAVPGGAAIFGAPGSGIEAAGVKDAGILRVHGDVVDVLRLLENRLPGGAGVGGQKHASARVDAGAAQTPRGEVHAAWVTWIQGETYRTVDALRQSDLLPVFGRVAGAVEGSVAPGAAALTAPRHHDIKRA